MTQHDVMNSHVWKQEFDDFDDFDNDESFDHSNNPLDYFLDSINSKGKY